MERWKFNKIEMNMWMIVKWDNISFRSHLQEHRTVENGGKTAFNLSRDSGAMDPIFDWLYK